VTTYAFSPSVTSVFTFQPTLDGQTYNCTVTWNLAGQRWYLNVYNLSGDLIVSRAMVGSDINSPPVNLAGGYFTTSSVAYYEDAAQIVVTP
jgi:hypothetical protein